MQYEIPSQLSKEIFRAYDIRGIVDQNHLNPNTIYAIGLALGTLVQREGKTTMIVGRDGRLSGPELFEALKTGILTSGCNVIDIGMVPTPVLYFATNVLETNCGVMLTGSHNPKNYNGLKMVVKAKTLTEDKVENIYHMILKKDFLQGHGVLKKQTVNQVYINDIVSKIKLKKPLKIVIDAGNGAAGIVAPDLFRALGCEVTALYCEVDGNFPNHHPDPSIPDNMRDLIDKVLELEADAGLAFDGDADRLGLVTNYGEIIYPDRQLMLFAKDLLTRLPGAEIIFDVKCTRFLPEIIEQNGGKPMMYKTGHSLLKAKMLERSAPMAGEMSGHFFFQEAWYGFDDGIYSGARMLEIISKDSRSCGQIFKDLPDSVNTPELKLALAEERKFDFMNTLKVKAQFPHAKINTIDGMRVDFKNGWGLIRSSNTTPYLTLRFEADTAKDLAEIQDIFRQQILAIDANLELPF